MDGLHNPEYVVQNLEGAKKFKDEFDPDFVKVMTDGLFFMPFNYEDVHCASDLKNLKATDEMDLYFEKKDEFDPDFVKVMTDGLFFMPFNYEDVHCASDLKNLKATDEMDLYFEKAVEFAKNTRAIYGDDVYMFYNVFSPCFQVNHRMNQVHPESTGTMFTCSTMCSPPASR